MNKLSYSLTKLAKTIVFGSDPRYYWDVTRNPNGTASVSVMPMDTGFGTLKNVRTVAFAGDTRGFSQYLKRLNVRGIQLQFSGDLRGQEPHTIVRDLTSMGILVSNA